MLYIAWMVIVSGHNIKKMSFRNFDCVRLYPLPRVGHGSCERREITVSTNNGLHVCKNVLLDPGKCIPYCTPQSGYHGVTKVAKNTDIAKTSKNCINYMNTCPTPLHTNPMEPRPEKTFSAQN